MQATITLHDLLKIILYLAGTGVLIYLALVLKNLLEILKRVNETIEENQNIIDDTIKKVPALTDNAVEITNNLGTISSETSEIMVSAKPEIEKLISSVGSITNTVSDISRSVDTTALKLTNTVSNVSDTISDTAKTISVNANNVIDYFYILKEIVESLKEVFLSK
ncbi:MULTISPECIES: hypothetical protein [Peptoniphilus]|uniref:hypothetical protein n=1 Tax=Peptoniphilus TaxID=162289 RepID=UPI0001DAA14B|nr:MULTISPECIES: hypothetical protein [Peptoniphilus]EFI41385.1 hypothetical protein HMPREF0629_00004 [Peptoniphilus sp. oral taxon 386 str. F0131]